MAKAYEAATVRDGYCRLAGVVCFGPCSGPSQFAHFGEWRRAKTRGMDPSERHSKERGLKLCSRHHGLYDGQLGIGRQLQILAMTAQLTDGPLAFEMDGRRWEE
jgi:hypothetical protein